MTTCVGNVDVEKVVKVKRHKPENSSKIVNLDAGCVTEKLVPDKLYPCELDL